MSLDWNITRVKNHEEIMSNNLQRQITEALIWASMAIDLGEITTNNVGEWWSRISTHPANDVPSFTVYNPAKDYYDDYTLTKADIERRIGLKTNVYSLNQRDYAAKLKKRYGK